MRGLGNAYELSGARRDKYLMARTPEAAGLGAPRSTLAASPQEAAAWFRASELDEVVVKPVGSAGSGHVRICREEAETAAARALVLGAADLFGQPNRSAVVQGHLRGPEFYVNTVSADGTLLPRTTGLLTSPGYPYPGGPSWEKIESDYRMIRSWEKDLLYTA